MTARRTQLLRRLLLKANKEGFAEPKTHQSVVEVGASVHRARHPRRPPSVSRAISRRRASEILRFITNHDSLVYSIIGRRSTYMIIMHTQYTVANPAAPSACRAVIKYSSYTLTSLAAP